MFRPTRMPWIASGVELVAGAGHGAVAGYDQKAVIANPTSNRGTFLHARASIYDAALVVGGGIAGLLGQSPKLVDPLILGGIFALSSRGVQTLVVNQGATTKTDQFGGAVAPPRNRPAGNSLRSTPRVGILG